MIDQNTDLGKLVAVHSPAPALTQRAIFLAIVSFVFFLLMMVAFSIREQIGYFLLGTAFLVVEIFTLWGWISLRKLELRIHENGVSFKKFSAQWTEIISVEKKIAGQKVSCIIQKTNGEKAVLTDAIDRVGEAIKHIESRTKQMDAAK